MALYKVRHAIANWTNEDGTPGMAFRGQVAEIPDKEASRLKRFFALIGKDEEVEHPGILSDLSVSPSDEEILNWIANANASEVRALVSKRPELKPRIEGALLNVKAARSYEDAHLNEVRLALQQGGLTPDDADGVLGSARTGFDTTDTSADGNDDIIVSPSLSTPPPIGGDTSSDPAENTVVPPEVSGVTEEDNTELKDANGNPDSAPSLPPVDHAVLVQGTGVDVANYIAAHPEEGAAILDAENLHTNDQPRPEVVNAVRSANGFTS